MKRVYIGFLISIAFLIGSQFSNVNGAAVMSLDLGNEWMKVGVVSPGVPMEIALNKESKRKTPTVIAFRNSERIYGEDAQAIRLRFPDQSFHYFIDLLGKQYRNPIARLHGDLFQYDSFNGQDPNDTPAYVVGDVKFTVEELIAQLIQKAREFAEDTTGQQIKECVIVVPGFFGQSERNGIMAAAKLADIKVLQLINDYTAVALNYGIFRRKEINETAQYFLFYDMGATKTTATVVSYQMLKDKATREMNPVIQILGVGYDRLLGGLAMQIRLRDYLATQFNKLGKIKRDIFKDKRAMAKLFKEAGRVKNVLSANTEHYAQVEGLIEEIDFKHKVTRSIFEEECADLFKRVTEPLDKALTASGLTIELMNQVILFGGGTRVPKVQETLRNHVNMDLSKNLNMDEAAAMGAVYKAADLATGFKVQKFVIKDAVVLPIQVAFERDLAGEYGHGGRRLVTRNLFPFMNAYPQKKVITFNKHQNDFTFTVNYADLDHLSADEISHVGTLNLTRVELHNIDDILNKVNADASPNAIESKGIKVHFVLDDSGILTMTNVDLVVEKTVMEIVEEAKTENDDSDDDESPFTKLGSTISKLFLNINEGGEKLDDVMEEEPVSGFTGGADDDDEEKKVEDSTNTTETTNTTTTSSKPSAINGTTAEATKTETKPRIKIIKEPIPNDVEYFYVKELDGENFVNSKAKIDELANIEKEIKRRDTALNALESFVFEMSLKLENTDLDIVDSEERVAIIEACTEISTWLENVDVAEKASEFENRLSDLKKLTNPMLSREWEHMERPEAVSTLKSIIDSAKTFLTNARNFTKDENIEKDVFTKVEIETLEKAISETVEWLKTEVIEQDKLKASDPVRLTIKLLSEKMAFLDREVKYLMNKLKIWKPKVKPTKKPNNDTAEPISDGDSGASGDNEPTIIGENLENENVDAENDDQVETPEIQQIDQLDPEPVNDDKVTPRTDL